MSDCPPQWYGSHIGNRPACHSPAWHPTRVPRAPPAADPGRRHQRTTTGSAWSLQDSPEELIVQLDSFCRETLEMGVFQGVRAYAEALEWLSWLRSGTDQEGKKCRGG